MSTRQYIGARYVPKFADPIEWDNARSYEALEIVTYLGTSYTSKKAVPVGTAITNTDYWVVTGNYNAQVEQYREAVEDYKEAVDGYKDDVDAYKDDVDEYKDTVDDYKDEVDAYEEEVQALFNKTHKFKHLVLIGDSYGTANGGGTAIATPFPTALKNMLGISDDYFHPSFSNGSGFGNGAFTTLLSNLVPSIEDKDSVTDVYFFGGWNDEANRVTQAQFLEGVADCEAIINTNFPNAVKHVVCWSNSRREFSINMYYTRGWYSSLANRGWATHMNIAYVLIEPSYYVSDGAHPNQNGVNAIAQACVDMILNGNANVNVRPVINLSTVTLETDIRSNFAYSQANLVLTVENLTTQVQLYMPNNNLSFVFQSGGVDTPRSITLNGEEIKVASLPQYTIKGRNQECGVNVTGWFIKSDDSGESIPIRIVFRTDGMYIKLPYQIGAGNVGRTLSVKSIAVPSGWQNVDSSMV